MKQLAKLKAIKRYVDGCLEIDISRRTRIDKYINARLAYYILSESYTRATLKEVGEVVGRDHATVIHGNNHAYLLKDKYKWLVTDFEPILLAEVLPEDVDLKEELRAALVEVARLTVALKEIKSFINEQYTSTFPA